MREHFFSPRQSPPGIDAAGQGASAPPFNVVRSTTGPLSTLEVVTNGLPLALRAHAEVWLPLLTLVLGYVGSIVTEDRRDRRAAERERSARSAERDTNRADREADFQRETLLDLQDAH